MTARRHRGGGSSGLGAATTGLRQLIGISDNTIFVVGLVVCQPLKDRHEWRLLAVRELLLS